MHIWVIEGKIASCDKWTIVYLCAIGCSRDYARRLSNRLKQSYNKTRVVKYISTKGE